METWEDTRLLEKIAQGDTRAMRVLYERHHDAMLGFVRSRGGDAALAGDVVHDAMLDVWKGAGRFRGSSSVRTWMFAIARNKLVDRLRGGARLSFVDAVPEPEEREPDAEAILAASQDAARVRGCLGKLKAVQRAVIRLAFYEGLAYDEIAEIEEVPVGTVKSRVFHARQALLRCLGR